MNVILRRSIMLILGAWACTDVCVAADGMELKSDMDKASYALGYQIGNDFKHQKMELNASAVVRGIADAQGGAVPLLTEESMRGILIELKHKVVAQERTAAPEIVKGAAAPEAVLATSNPQDTATAKPHAKRASARANENSREFFEKNARHEGVVTLPSGVQYKVLKEGNGRQPQLEDKVTLIYRGAFANGNEFGNTDQDGKAVPRTYSLNSLVPGLREAVSRMKEGAQWQVFLPPQLGFDASTPLYRRITVFDISLVSVVSG